MAVSVAKQSHGPSRLGRYDVRAKIADGGMAAVYVARRDDGEIVAIKMIREEFSRKSDFLTMLLDEAKIVSRLRHPNIVRYLELSHDDAGHAFIVMELLFGQSLWAVWDACRARGVRLRYDMIAWLGARVAEGLHYAHELVGEDGNPTDIVHRDVNATNIFVTYDGGVKVIDFGLAKATHRASKTAEGVIKGKVAYMSPEQAIGAPIDRRTDVFALGTTLWELSCDRRLFKHSDEVETLRRVHAADVPDPTRIVDGYPPALARVVRRALARDRDRRYPTAAELAADLDAFAGGAVNASVVADVMRELFALDRARQAAWVAEASAPDGPGGLEPLKPPTTFWNEPDAAPSASVRVRPAPEAPSVRIPWYRRRLAMACLAVAVAVAVVVAVVLGVR